MFRGFTAVLALAGAGFAATGCSPTDLGLDTPSNSAAPKPTPAPDTLTPNVDQDLSASWVILPGGTEKVLCVMRIGTGDPRIGSANGLSMSCDWENRKPVAEGGAR